MRIGVRTDSSCRIGTGHVMRCLALAQAARKKGAKVTFLSADNVAAVQTKLKNAGMAISRLICRPGSDEDARKTVRHARKIKTDYLVVDGYQFGEDYQRTIRDSGLPFLFIDDHAHAGSYRADIILNQNISAAEKLYKKRPFDTRLLLGTRYVLLRNEFLAWKGKKKRVPSVAKKVLVTMGGSDPDNVTLKVVRALERLTVERLQAIIVVGPGNPHLEVLKKFCRWSKYSLTIKKNPKNMVRLMAWADAAVSAAGGTYWELAFMGVPSLLITTGDNQEGAAKELHKRRAAINLGWHQNISADRIAKELGALLGSMETRKKIGSAAQKMVDGKGAQRVVECIAAR